MSSISLFLLRLTATYILMCSGIKFPDKIQMNIFIMSGKNSLVAIFLLQFIIHRMLNTFKLILEKISVMTHPAHSHRFSVKLIWMYCSLSISEEFSSSQSITISTYIAAEIFMYRASHFMIISWTRLKPNWLCQSFLLFLYFCCLQNKYEIIISWKI